MSHVLRCSGYELVKTDIVRARDCCLYDAHGRRYVDLEAGVWCVGLGHGNPRINRALQTQLARIAHIGYRYTTALVEEAATTVLDSLDLSDGKCVFLSSGSEAVEFGVQVARRVTEQPLLLTLSDSYLAAYGSAGRKSPDEWVALDWSACTACPHPERCDPACPHLGGIPFERIGGLVFEPGSAGGRVRFPPTQLVQGLAEQVKRVQGLTVVDEVTTGLGRTGTWYGFQHYDVQPDIVALGKGLGNGYPVSAVALTGDVSRQLEDSSFHYAQSHQNDPLGCAVAREVITILREDGLVERSAEVGAYFLHELQRLGERHQVVKNVRGRGLMIALELRDADGASLAILAHRRLLERGFLVGCKPAFNILRFFPPLKIGREDVAQLLKELDRFLEEVHK
ncbi:MAG: aspartate aminotransferase family protein [Anaerolineae bacterium]|jgi:acetylornithine aminotransferase